MSTTTIAVSISVGAGAALALMFLVFLLTAKRRRAARRVSLAGLKSWFRRRG